MKQFFRWMVKSFLFGLALGLVITTFSGQLVLTCAITLIFTFFVWGSEELVHHVFISRLKTTSVQKLLVRDLSLSWLVAFLAAIAAILLIKLLLGISFLPSSTDGFTNFFFVMLISLSATTIFVSIDYAANYYEEAQKRIIKEKEAKAAAIKAELKALKAQINPHFLFNTLNTIAALARLNPAQAEKTAEDLAEMYRYILHASEKESVSLKQELEFIATYLRIAKARFGEKLKVEEEISPSIVDTLIPSLLLQPIIENAIKHGISESSEKGKIKITAHKEKELIKIQIEDNGPGIPDHIFSKLFLQGTGLKNIAERLKNIYGREDLLHIENRTPQGVLVTITLPQKG